MTLKEYTECCVKFSDETMAFGDLDPYKFYTTGYSSWEESSDNANNGISVRWAFHETKEEIRKKALHHFVSSLKEELEIAEDEGFDSDQVERIIEKYR